MRTALRFATLLAVLPFIAAVPCRAEDGPKLPDGVDALPKELSVRLKELLKNAEKYRGLKCLHGVPSGALKEDALRVKMKLAFEEELPPAKMKPLDSALKSFGLIPETMNLGTYYPELLTSQVGGFYDPRRQYLVIVQREGGLLGKEATAKLGADMARKMEETVMVHELTHAIQDQNFNLKKFMIEDPLSDAAAARVALVEGDATLTMYDFLSGMRLEEMPMVEDLMAGILKDPKELMAMSPDMPGAKEMENAPAWFRDGMLFSYMQGFIFCIKVKKAGGQALLDHAFTKDPPRSTEQILHPEKWYQKRDDPIDIAMPGMAEQLPGWTKASEGTLGELGIKIWLNETLKDNEKAGKAAEGWGGDRFAVFEKNDARILCWVTDWDTAEDAAKFKAVCGKLGGDWMTKTDEARRVTLTRATGGGEKIAALHTALNSATASVPENKAIQIAAVRKAGTKAPDDIAANDPEKLLGKDGDLDLDKLLNDPNTKKMLKQFGGGADGLDMGELMKNPLVKDMLKKMLTEKSPSGNVSKDGREYANEAMGVTIKMPDSAKDWKLNGSPKIPMVLLVADSPDQSAHVQIASQNMPIVMPIESLGPMMEMGFKMSVTDYKKFKEGPIGEGAAKGYEFQISGEQAGTRARMITRFYMRGGKMLVINASSEEGDWKKNEKILTDILNGIKLSEPKPDEKKDTAKPVAPDDVLK